MKVFIIIALVLMFFELCFIFSRSGDVKDYLREVIQDVRNVKVNVDVRCDGCDRVVTGINGVERELSYVYNVCYGIKEICDFQELKKELSEIDSADGIERLPERIWKTYIQYLGKDREYFSKLKERLDVKSEEIYGTDKSVPYG